MRMICPTTSKRNDVINFQFAALAATGALSFVPLVENMNIIWRAFWTSALHTAVSINALGAQHLLVSLRILIDPLINIGSIFLSVLLTPTLLVGLILFEILNSPFCRLLALCSNVVGVSVPLMVGFLGRCIAAFKTCAVYDATRGYVAMRARFPSKVMMQAARYGVRFGYFFHISWFINNKWDEQPNYGVA